MTFLGREMVEVGDFVKVILPEERPWAMVRIVHTQDNIEAVLDNFLVATDVHGYSYEDVIVLKRKPDSDFWLPNNQHS